MAHLHPEVRFYEEVRVWMAKFDAEDRQAAFVDHAAARQARLPSGKQPAAIKLVLEQMESIAPRYAADRT